MRLVPVFGWTKGVQKALTRRERFIKAPWSQGVVLLICVVVAMLLANLPFTCEVYRNVLETNLQIHIFNDDVNILFPREMTVEKFINDILMVVFFFTVGLEIKREIRYGELSSPKKAIMPIIAAFGGVVAPAVIFTIINHGTAASSGWGIPTATDIAFAVCILTVLGDKVPIAMKVFLTALAIADDLIAILVVAFFYGGSINLPLLLVSFGVMGLIMLLRKVGEKRFFPYFLMSIAVWVLFYYSGIHATMTGVVMAFLIPSTPRYNKSQYYRKRNFYIRKLDEFEGAYGQDFFPNEPQRFCLMRLQKVASGSINMSSKLEQVLSTPVNFIIMPLFALANAGVQIPSLGYLNICAFDAAVGSVGLGIFLGLLLGKPLGITLVSWIAVKFKLGEMPKDTTWPMFIAVACLGGIGFTMSIFVDTLSFGDQVPMVTEALRNIGKIAVLFGSICSGILGTILVNLVCKKK